VRVDGGPLVDPLSGSPLPDQPEWSQFSLDIDARTLYLDNSELRRGRAIQDAAFVIGTLNPWLMMHGVMINPVQYTRDLAHRADMRGLPDMMIPASPMAMQMAQMAGMQGAATEQQVASDVNTRDAVQQNIMNSDPTNMAISEGAVEAGPMRMAMTPFGANNQETSFQ
jgi:hypothetical protein